MRGDNLKASAQRILDVPGVVPHAKAVAGGPPHNHTQMSSNHTHRNSNSQQRGNSQMNPLNQAVVGGNHQLQNMNTMNLTSMNLMPTLSSMANTAGPSQGLNQTPQAPFQVTGLANISGMNILNTTSNNGISGSFGKMSGQNQNPNMTLLTAGQGSSMGMGQQQFSSHDHSNMMVTAYNNMHNQGSSSRVMTSEHPPGNSVDYGGMMMTGGLRMGSTQQNLAGSDPNKSNNHFGGGGQTYSIQ